MFIDVTIYNKDKMVIGYYNENANILNLKEVIIDLFRLYLNEATQEIERKYNEIYK